MAKNSQRTMGIALAAIVIVIAAVYFLQTQSAPMSAPAVQEQVMTADELLMNSKTGITMLDEEIQLSQGEANIPFAIYNSKSSQTEFVLGFRCTDLVGSDSDRANLNTGRYIRFDTTPMLTVPAGKSSTAILRLSADSDAPATTYMCMMQASVIGSSSVETYATQNFKVMNK